MTLAATQHKTFSFGRVRAIASNTLLEMFRLKIFYFLLLFGMAMIGSSLFFVNLTFQEQFQILKDVSLGAMSIFTWLARGAPHSHAPAEGYRRSHALHDPGQAGAPF